MDNVHDCMTKARRANIYGEHRASAKLTDAQVLHIKTLLADGGNQSAIARMYGVTSNTINAIARGRNWRH
jgi:hypothetical protein